VPKINVYLPDDLAAMVREARLPVSAICQTALQQAAREVTALREAGPSAPGGELGWAATSGMAFARYTNRARRALALARQQALELGHAYVGTEHLLLGILDERDNHAVRVIDSLGVDPDDLRAELNGYLRPGEAHTSETPLTAHVRAALESATNESSKLGHNYIGCEHILLGLISEPEGLAGSVLRQLGLDLQATRRAVAAALAAYAQAVANEPTVSRNRLDEILRRLDDIEAKLAS